MSTNASIEPATYSAMTLALSLAELTKSPYIISLSETSSPGKSPMPLEPGGNLTAVLLTVNVSLSLPCSKARIAVIILVVLAGNTF